MIDIMLNGEVKLTKVQHFYSNSLQKFATNMGWDTEIRHNILYG